MTDIAYLRRTKQLLTKKGHIVQPRKRAEFTTTENPLYGVEDPNSIPLDAKVSVSFKGES